MTDNDIVKYFLKHRRVVASDEDIAWLKSVGDPQEIITNDYDLLNVEYWACIQNRLGVKISYPQIAIANCNSFQKGNNS